MDKQKIKETEQKIIGLLKGFCDEKLDKNYFELAEKLTQKLGRKRTVPFATGKPEIWAAAIIHALGTINFLFDKSFEPFATLDDINDYFSTNKSTVTGKSKIIRDLLKLGIYDREFSTNRLRDNNPYNNLVMVDGLWISVSSIPEQFQVMLKEARAMGQDLNFSTQ